jgi:hypothetical protein
MEDLFYDSIPLHISMLVLFYSFRWKLFRCFTLSFLFFSLPFSLCSCMYLFAFIGVCRNSLVLCCFQMPNRRFYQGPLSPPKRYLFPHLFCLFFFRLCLSLCNICIIILSCFTFHYLSVRKTCPQVICQKLNSFTPKEQILRI